MLLRKMSGHMYRGSAYESSDSCGNCDGARCEHCVESFAWYGYDEQWFRTAAEAQEYGERKERERADLVPGVEVKNLTNVMWILVGDELHCHYYDADEGPYGAYKTAKCNPNNPLYYDLWAEAVDRRQAYDRCAIADKGQGYHFSYCQMFGQCNGEWDAVRCRRDGCYNM